MRQLVLKDAVQCRHASACTAYRNSQLSIILTASPGWRVGDVEEVFLRVQNHDDAFAWFVSELSREVAKLIFQSLEQRFLQFRRSLVSFVLQREVGALSLARTLLNFQFAFR